jgi:16S rRNA (cytosine967-C5)-methyltransferase
MSGVDSTADAAPLPGGAGDTGGRAGANAPALHDVLVLAAAAWLGVQDGQSLDRALEAVLQPAPDATPVRSPPAQARLGGAVRDLAAATVRRAATLDFLLTRLVHRPPDPAVGALLAVGLAQLLARSYADFTLVDQAVRAARAQPRTAAAAGLVNAVLRAFLRQRDALEAEAGADLQRRFNVPAWWLRRVQSEYGPRATALLAAQLEEPPMVLRVNCRRTTVPQMLERLRGQGMAARQVGPTAVWLERAVPVERIPGFLDGWVSVQDAGAQMAGPLLEVAAGMRVLDVCAAPGGKTAQLLELADCRVDAVEFDPQRARRIGANLERLGLAGPTARVVVADALDPTAYWNGVPYDRILLDAPCTASGVVRRHPDVVLLRRESDVVKLATQQAKMLQTLWPLLAPAGRLLYVVCSVFAEEGRRQVSSFLQRQPGARSIRIPGDDLAGLQLLPCTTAATAVTGAQPDATAIPVLHDGFFFALLEKT